MGDPTRKDAGAAAPKLFVTFEMDLATSVVTIETNVADTTTMMRVVGQGMHIWADDVMRKRIETAVGAPKRPLVLPMRLVRPVRGD